MLEGGDRFKYQSVVDHYHHRPDYPESIYHKLFSLVNANSIVLDIGCGPGKLSYPVSERVARVDAVDQSLAMIEAARQVPLDDTNINWIIGDIHAVELDTGYDLVLAGASIHWMDWDRLFPMLASRLSHHGRCAFLDGDGPVDHPWGAEELALMKEVQLEINEERPIWVDRAQFPAPRKTKIVDHPMFRIEETMFARRHVSCSIDDYIGTFFARQSFALDCMPVETADRFRRDMKTLLASYTKDDLVEYEIETMMETGRLV